jgi:hypothetical protein
VKQKEVFFFEKKNQTTFVRSGKRRAGRVRLPVRAQGQKFFGSFFQKRTLP